MASVFDNNSIPLAPMQSAGFSTGPAKRQREKRKRRGSVFDEDSVSVDQIFGQEPESRERQGIFDDDARDVGEVFGYTREPSLRDQIPPDKIPEPLQRLDRQETETSFLARNLKPGKREEYRGLVSPTMPDMPERAPSRLGDKSLPVQEKAGLVPREPRPEAAMQTNLPAAQTGSPQASGTKEIPVLSEQTPPEQEMKLEPYKEREGEMGFMEKWRRIAHGARQGRSDLHPAVGLFDYFNPVSDPGYRSEVAQITRRLNPETRDEALSELTDNDLAQMVYGTPLRSDMEYDRQRAIELLTKRDREILVPIKEWEKEKIERRAGPYSPQEVTTGFGEQARYTGRFVMGAPLFIAGELGAGYEERRAGDVTVDDEGNIISLSEGEEAYPAALKSAVAAPLQYLIERYTQKAIGAGGKALGKGTAKGLEKLTRGKSRMATEYVKTVARKLKSGVSVPKAIRSGLDRLERITGIQGLVDEIILEEGAEALLMPFVENADDWRQIGPEVDKSIEQFIQEIPYMIGPMSLMRGGQYGMAAAMAKAGKGGTEEGPGEPSLQGLVDRQVSDGGGVRLVDPNARPAMTEGDWGGLAPERQRVVSALAQRLRQRRQQGRMLNVQPERQAEAETPGIPEGMRREMEVAQEAEAPARMELLAGQFEEAQRRDALRREAEGRQPRPEEGMAALRRAEEGVEPVEQAGRRGMGLKERARRRKEAVDAVGQQGAGSISEEQQAGAVPGIQEQDTERGRFAETSQQEEAEEAEEKRQLVENVQWMRGEREENAAGDKFFSASEGVAGDYGAVRQMEPAERPSNPLVVDSKGTLADAIGYKGDPYAEPASTPPEQRFDVLAKDYARKQGHDAIVYRGGTFDEPEMHVFEGAAEGRGTPAPRGAIDEIRAAVNAPTDPDSFRRLASVEQDQSIPDNVRRVAKAARVQMNRAAVGNKPLSARALGEAVGLPELERAVAETQGKATPSATSATRESGLVETADKDAFGNPATRLEYRSPSGASALASVRQPTIDEQEYVGDGRVLNITSWSATPLSAIASRGLQAESDYKGKGFARTALTSFVNRAREMGAEHIAVFAPSEDSLRVMQHYTDTGVITPVPGAVDAAGRPRLWKISDTAFKTTEKKGAQSRKEKLKAAAAQRQSGQKKGVGGVRIVAAALKDPRTGEVFTGATHGLANPRDTARLNLDIADNPQEYIGYVTETGRYVDQAEAKARWGIDGAESSAAFLENPNIRESYLGRGDNPLAEPYTERQLSDEIASRRQTEDALFAAANETESPQQVQRKATSEQAPGSRKKKLKKTAAQRKKKKSSRGKASGKQKLKTAAKKRSGKKKSPAKDTGIEDIISEASRRAGFPLKQGNIVEVFAGRSKKPYRAKLKAFVDNETVRLEPAGPAGNSSRWKKNNVGDFHAVTKLIPTAQAVGAQRRTQALEGFSAKEKRKINAAAREFDRIVTENAPFTTLDMENEIEAMGKGIQGGMTRGRLKKQARATAAELLEKDRDIDTDSPVVRAELLPELKELMKEGVTALENKLERIIDRDIEKMGEDLDGIFDVLEFRPGAKSPGWAPDFPDIVVHAGQNTGVLRRRSDDFEKAKKGDFDAAERVALRHIDVAKARALAEKHPNARLVPVHAIEASGINLVPSLTAARISKLTGLPVDEEIVQTRGGHTGAGAAARLLTPPRFGGEVISGQEYIGEDDVNTSGGSLQKLREHIESRGGRMVAATTLVAARARRRGENPASLALSDSYRDRLEEKFDTDALIDVLSEYGAEIPTIEHLTNAQAGYILTFKNLESFRRKLAKVQPEIDAKAREAEGGGTGQEWHSELRLQVREQVERYVEEKEIPAEKKAVREQLEWIELISNASAVPYDQPGSTSPRSILSPDTQDAAAEFFKELSRVSEVPTSVREESASSLSKAFAQEGDTVSSIIHDRFTGTPSGWYITGKKIESPRDVAALMAPLRSPYQESMKAVFLAGDNTILKAEIITVGLLDASLVHPREMFQHAPVGTAKVILCHNHPSGDPKPSSEDIRVSRQLVEAGELLGYEVTDHIITDTGTYYSMREQGVMKFPEVGPYPQKPRGFKPQPLTEKERGAFDEPPAWERTSRSERYKVTGQKGFRAAVDMLRQGDPDMGHLVLLDTRNRIQAVHRFALTEIQDTRALTARLVRSAVAESANAVMLDLPVTSQLAWPVVRDVYQGFDAAYIKLLDVVDVDRMLWRGTSWWDMVKGQASGAAKQKGSVQEGPARYMDEGEGFELESVSAEEIDAERAKRIRKEKLAAEQAKRLEGEAGDLSGDLFDARDNEAGLWANLVESPAQEQTKPSRDLFDLMEVEGVPYEYEREEQRQGAGKGDRPDNRRERDIVDKARRDFERVRSEVRRRAEQSENEVARQWAKRWEGATVDEGYTLTKQAELIRSRFEAIGWSAVFIDSEQLSGLTYYKHNTVFISPTVEEITDGEYTTTQIAGHELFHIIRRAAGENPTIERFIRLPLEEKNSRYKDLRRRLLNAYGGIKIFKEQARRKMSRSEALKPGKVEAQAEIEIAEEIAASFFGNISYFSGINIADAYGSKLDEAISLRNVLWDGFNEEITNMRSGDTGGVEAQAMMTPDENERMAEYIERIERAAAQKGRAVDITQTVERGAAKQRYAAYKKDLKEKTRQRMADAREKVKEVREEERERAHQLLRQVSESHGKALSMMREHRDDVQKMQRELMKHARHNLPKHYRDKLFADIARLTGTAEDATAERYYQEAVKKLQVFTEQATREKLREKLTRYNRLKSIDGDYRDQLNKILAKFKVAKRQRTTVGEDMTLRQFRDHEMENGIDLMLSDEALEVFDFERLEDMDLETMESFSVAVDVIVGVGQRKRRLFDEKKDRDFAEVRNMITGRVFENDPDMVQYRRRLKKMGYTVEVDVNPETSELQALVEPAEGQKPKKGTKVKAQNIKKKIDEHLDQLDPRYRTPSERDPEGVWQKLKKAKDTGSAWLTKAEYVLEALDGFEENGPIHREIFQRVADAEMEELMRGEEMGRKIDAALTPLKNRLKTIQGETIDVAGRKMTREHAMAVYANSRHEDNRYRLVKGNQFTMPQINEIVNILTAEEKRVVDNIMDIVGAQYDEIATIAEVLTGVRPPKVEPYWPIQADTGASEKALEQQQEANLMRQVFSRAAVERGFTKTRKGGSDPVELRFFRVVTGHVFKTNHFITHAIAVRNVQRILADPDVKRFIVAARGRAEYRQLMPWLKHVANPRQMKVTNDLQNVAERFVGGLRRNTTTAFLGLKLSVALKQQLSLSQTVNRIGLKWTAKGMEEFYKGVMTNPRELRDFIYSRSTALKYRRANWDKELREWSKQKAPIPLSSKDPKMQAILFSLITLNDKMATLPSWLGAYYKKMRETNGNEADAIRYADMIVRRTQPTASPKDLAPVMRGSNFQRLFVMFYTFFSQYYNETRRAAEMRRLGKISQTDAFVSFFWRTLFPAIASQAIASLFYSSDDDEPWYIEYGKGLVSYRLAMYPVVGSFINAMMHDYTFQVSPAFESFASLSRTIKTKDWNKKAQYALETSGFAFGWPSRQAVQTWRAIEAMMNDETDDWSVLLRGAGVIKETARRRQKRKPQRRKYR